MQGTLTLNQIDTLLYNEDIGRIGYQLDNRLYITPINYVYDGQNISAYSLYGSKLQAMRQNPDVCFQVDHIIDSVHWQSVLTWGRFEELAGNDALKSMHLLIQHNIVSIASGKSLHQFIQTANYQRGSDTQNIFVYRIHLFKKTGKFEQDESSAHHKVNPQ